MGLIKALVNSVGGSLGDQWKEYFYTGSKISRNYLLFEPKCRNNAEITYM